MNVRGVNVRGVNVRGVDVRGVCILIPSFSAKYKRKLEALRERRPPWPRQIITLILPTVKMLSLGCERLQIHLKKKKKKKGSGSLPAPRSGYATTIMVIFCSFTHLTIPRSPPKFNQFSLVLLRTPP